MSEKIRGAAQQIVSLSERFDTQPTKRQKLAVLNAMLEHVSAIENSLGKKGEIGVGAKEKQALADELHIDKTHLRRALSPVGRAAYEGNVYGKIANLFFEPVSRLFLRLFPRVGRRTERTLRGAGLRVLSLSYVSMVLFACFVLLFVGTAVGAVLYYLYAYLWSLFVGVGLAVLALSVFVFYPLLLRRRRRRAQDREYPFVVTHLAALANGGAKQIDIFRALAFSHHSSYIGTELNMIINDVAVLGRSLPDALRHAAEGMSSTRMRQFLHEYASVVESRRDIREFLNGKSSDLLKEAERKTGGIRRYRNTYADVRMLLSQLRFQWVFLVGILGAIALLIAAFGYLSASMWFTPLLVVATLVGWGPFVMVVYSMYRRNKQLETHFFYLAQELKRTRNPTKLQRQYGELDPYVRKLMNQYRVGIPIEQTMTTFARDTDNPLIQSLVATVVESKKHGANFYDTLEQVTTSAILANVLKTDLR